MAREEFPSYVCDCGHEAHFFEGTIEEMKRISRRKKVDIGDADHAVVFHKGKAIEMICPTKGRCPIE